MSEVALLKKHLVFCGNLLQKGPWTIIDIEDFPKVLEWALISTTSIDPWIMFDIEDLLKILE